MRSLQTAIKIYSASLFPDGPMLKEEAMLIKKRLIQDDLTSFSASNGSLKKV